MTDEADASGKARAKPGLCTCLFIQDATHRHQGEAPGAKHEADRFDQGTEADFGV